MLTMTVAICTYERRSLLETCLDHWTRSYRLPDQLIVVDASAAAEDNRREIIDTFPSLFERGESRYVTTDKPGLTRQRNLALEHVTSDIVCLIDDDTFVRPDYARKILQIFEADRSESIAGLNGVAVGQFDSVQRLYSRIGKETSRLRLGRYVRRIHVPRDQTHVTEPLPDELDGLPLLQMDRLWGANMNYRTDVIKGMQFDESFQRYGLYEDVDFSVRVGLTHRLAIRVDAEVFHDTDLGQGTRPAEGRYFLMSWVNSTYVIEKLFPCTESRKPQERLFHLTELISAATPPSVRMTKRQTLGDHDLFEQARAYMERLRRAKEQGRLEAEFREIQEEVLALSLP